MIACSAGANIFSPLGIRETLAHPIPPPMHERRHGNHITMGELPFAPTGTIPNVGCAFVRANGNSPHLDKITLPYVP